MEERRSGERRRSGEVGSGGPAAKGRAADLRTARLGEKDEVCFRDLMGGEGNVFNPLSVSYLQYTIFVGDITRYTVDPRSRSRSVTAGVPIYFLRPDRLALKSDSRFKGIYRDFIRVF